MTPAPIPPIAAPRWSKNSESATELITPRNRNQCTTNPDHQARPILVHQIALERNEPGLGQHENREGDLNCRLTPMVFLIDGIDEQGPACRLAIITMQMIPSMSWPHRVASDMPLPVLG